MTDAITVTQRIETITTDIGEVITVNKPLVTITGEAEQGPRGPTGPMGTGVAWRGEYDPTASYLLFDAVSYLGSSYACDVPCTGVVPTDTDNWELVASKGDTGADSTVTGPQGEIGLTGPKGDAGSAGADSTVPGPQGVQGLQGIQGIQGETGTAGEDSIVPGPQGEIGDTGPQGDTGAVGADSTVAGPIGDTGVQGIQGIQGPAGADGVDGDAFVYADFTEPQLAALIGPQGEQGIQGNAGAAGADSTVVGPTGAMGADSIIPGPQGIQGETGIAGADSIVAGPKGDTGLTGAAGSNGTNGTNGIDGVTPVKGVDYVDGVDGTDGTNGTDGAKGDTGLTGAKGDTGTTGATGAAGADSTVAGPKGDTGLTGSTGAAGAKGDTGLTGSAGSNGTNGTDGAKGDTGSTGAAGTTDYTALSNKPTLGTAAAKNIPATGNAAATEVVYGSDTRLTDARTPSSHTHLLAAGATDVTATAAELNYVDGVTSAIQTQLNAKVASSTISAAGAELINDANSAAQLATLGAAAYSGGTWTPVLNSFTIVGSAPAVLGRYRRIGNLVYVECVIKAGASGNTSVASTVLTSNISGLLVTESAGMQAICPVINGDSMANLGLGTVYANSIYPPTFGAVTQTIFFAATYCA